MAVVIHEREVVPQDPSAAAPRTSAAGATPAAGGEQKTPTVGTLDVHRIARHVHLRGLRVWAH